MSCCKEVQDPNASRCVHPEHKQEQVLENHGTVMQEILCHLPYAIFSVALAMIVLSFLSYSQSGLYEHRLFHSFHFLHILFAATGTIIMFRKYSTSKIQAVLVGIFVPAIFCTMSDTLLPYVGGALINLPMEFHWCFLSHIDTIIPFLAAGILNGWVMSSHEASRQVFYSLGFHFFHIFISSMASILYLVSFGFTEWWTQMGFVFMYMILVVLIPCTLADIVVPILFARLKKIAFRSN